MTKPTKIILLSLCFIIALGILTLFFTSQARFLKFCDTFFQEEMQNNTLTMHYTISDPEKYGIECSEITLGSYDIDKLSSRLWLTKKYLSLETISRKGLSSDLQKLYDLVKYSVRTEMKGIDFTLLEEPLVPSIGIQSQLPILLAEYAFQNEADVVNYLTLLTCVPEYFDSLLNLEEEKISEGLFMDPETAAELISYCEEFLASKETHFLSETFHERLSALNLSEKKCRLYTDRHASVLDTCIFPAYETLKSFLTRHQDKGTNAHGLYYYPNGTDYYAWLLRSEIGCDKSFEEIERLLADAQKKDAGIISALVKNHPNLLSERQTAAMDTSNPAGLTSYLAKRTTHDFPEIQKVTLEICDVPKSMEPHLSPAFYLIPPIDSWEKNVVYLNHGCLNEGISFFTTLAHESYPGHLYQTIYENSTDPHPLQRLLYFGGYAEGWGTYAEQLSYYYAPISEDMATLLSTTRAMNLNLYAHLDLYVHAYGWTEDDCKAYLKKFGITNSGSVHEMFMLVKQQPANYLKYYLGYLEICALKEQARDCLGSAFDLKKFHEFVLDYGPAPFCLLEMYFTDWVWLQQKGFSESENPQMNFLEKRNDHKPHHRYQQTRQHVQCFAVLNSQNRKP